MACRLCLHIFQKNYEDRTISSISTEEYVSGDYVLALSLMPELNLELSNPVIICKACTKTMAVFSAFVDTCKSSERKLSSYKEEHGQIQDLMVVFNTQSMDLKCDNLGKKLFCCICLKNRNSSQLQNLLDEPLLVKFLKDAASIKEILSIPLAKLCNQCTITLEELYSFKHMCIMTQEHIKCLYNKLNKVLKNEDLVVVAKRQGVKQEINAIGNQHRAVILEQIVPYRDTPQKSGIYDKSLTNREESNIDKAHDSITMPSIQMVDDDVGMECQEIQSADTFDDYSNGFGFSISDVYTVKESASTDKLTVSKEAKKSNSFDAAIFKGFPCNVKIGNIIISKVVTSTGQVYVNSNAKQVSNANVESDKNEITNLSDCTHDSIIKSSDLSKVKSTENKLYQCKVSCISGLCEHSVKSKIGGENDNNALFSSDGKNSEVTNHLERDAGPIGCETILFEDLTLVSEDDIDTSISAVQITGDIQNAQDKFGYEKTVDGLDLKKSKDSGGDHKVSNAFQEMNIDEEVTVSVTNEKCKICDIWSLCQHFANKKASNISDNHTIINVETDSTLNKPAKKPKVLIFENIIIDRDQVNDLSVSYRTVLDKSMIVAQKQTNKASRCKSCGIWGLCRHFKEGYISNVNKNNTTIAFLNSYLKSKKIYKHSRKRHFTNKSKSKMHAVPNVKSAKKDIDYQKDVHAKSLINAKDLTTGYEDTNAPQEIITEKVVDARGAEARCKVCGIWAFCKHSMRKNVNNRKNKAIPLLKNTTSDNLTDSPDVIFEDAIVNVNQVNNLSVSDKNTVVESASARDGNLSQCKLCGIWGLCFHVKENGTNNTNKSQATISFSDTDRKLKKVNKGSSRKHVNIKLKNKAYITRNFESDEKDVEYQKSIDSGTVNSKRFADNKDNNSLLSEMVIDGAAKTVRAEDKCKACDVQGDCKHSTTKNISNESNNNAANHLIHFAGNDTDNEEIPFKGFAVDNDLTLPCRTIDKDKISVTHGQSVMCSLPISVLGSFDIDHTRKASKNYKNYKCRKTYKMKKCVETKKKGLNTADAKRLKESSKYNNNLYSSSLRECEDSTVICEGVSVYSGKPISNNHKVTFSGIDFTCVNCCVVTTCKHLMKRHLDNQPRMAYCNICCGATK